MFISPAVVGNSVILGSCSGSVYALDRTSGKPVWIYDTRADGSTGQFHGEALVIGERIVLPSDSDPKAHLYSFDVATGDVAWKVPFNNGVNATPLLIEGRVVAIARRGEVVGLDAASGEVEWIETPFGALEPSFFVPAPAAVGKRIFVADNVDELVALDAASGATVWRKTLPARADTALVVVGKNVVVGTVDGSLLWIDAESGEVKRKVDLGAMPYGTPILSSSQLFVLAGNRLLALDAESGAVQWKQETVKEWMTYRPLVTDSEVIAGSDQKDLCAFDRKDGTRRWCRSIGQVPRGLALSKDGILYVGSYSGVVQAFRYE